MRGSSRKLHVHLISVARRFFQVSPFILFGFAGIQVFFFSSFSELQIREIDDLAFERSIWNLYEAYSTWDLPIVFGITDYGYGWLYWTATAALSSPGYFLYLFAADQVWISVLPRLLSLFCVFGSWYFLRKISWQLGFSKLVQDAIGVVFLLLPPVLWFGMRFGTVSVITLLTLLSISHLLGYKKGSKSIWWGSVFFGLAIGVKLSALVLLPLFLVLVIERTRKTQKFRWGALGASFLAFILSAHPPLVFSGFVPNILTRWLEIQRANISNAGGVENPFERFPRNTFDLFVSQPVYLILLISALFCLWHLFSKKKFSNSALLGFALVVLVLILLMGFAGNVYSAISYSLPYAVLASLAFGFLIRILPRMGTGLLGFTLVLLLVWNLAGLVLSLEKRGNPMNFGYYYAKHINSQEEINSAKLIKKLLDSNDFLSVAHDFTAPVGVTPLEYPNSCIHVIFDNLGSEGSCGLPLEWIVLDSRKSLNIDQLDAIVRSEFTKTRSYFGVNYSLVSQTGAFDVFRLAVK